MNEKKQLHTTDNSDVTPASEQKTPRRRVPEKEKPRYWIVLLLILLMFLVAAVFTMFVIRAFYRPGVDTGIPFDTTTAPSRSSDVVSDPVTTSGDNPVVRDPDTVNFLVMGKDFYGANTDVIMIVNFNTKTYQMNVVQILRDTYVRYEKEGCANTVYAHFLSSEKNIYTGEKAKRYAMEETVKTFEQLFSIKLDYYALVELSVFKRVIDDIGGVYVTVPFDMDYDDPAQNLYIHLRKGYQLLDGDKAEQFVRFRMGYLLADEGRVDAMKIFMSAILKKLTTDASVTQIVNAVKDVFDNLTTNVTAAEAQYYATALMKADLGNVIFVTMPGQSDRTIGWKYVVQRSTALQIVNDYLNVTNGKVDDAVFDKDRCLTDPTNAMMLGFYNSESIELKPYRATEAGNITIPHYNN
ncbi:MAG: LCP family protein [Eubacteriales bacterium]|nr:LCP family protein [Eubacteriales bacterium]